MRSAASLRRTEHSKLECFLTVEGREKELVQSIKRLAAPADELDELALEFGDM
jgi:hypothetical protein